MEGAAAEGVVQVFSRTCLEAAEDEIRLDLSERYEELVDMIAGLGPPAVSALYGVLEQISERDERRAAILQRCRRILGSILLERQMRSKAQQRARTSHLFDEPDPAPVEVEAADLDTEPFVALHRELLTGISFEKRGEEVKPPPVSTVDADTVSDVSNHPSEPDGDEPPEIDS